MPVLAALLHGVNADGYHRIRMDGLRALCESLCLRNAQTYLETGNIVFEAPWSKVPGLARRLEKAIEKVFCYRPSVILRSSARMHAVVHKNPFEERREVLPSKLAVVFPTAKLGVEEWERVRALATGSDELLISGREVYVYFPNGMEGSQRTLAAIDSALQVPATVRDWNTVVAIHLLALRMDPKKGRKRPMR